MCEPVTMTAGLALLNFAGSAAQSWGQQQAAFQQAQFDRLQARMADMAAGDARQRGAQEAGRVRMQGSRIVGEQKAAMGASGVDPSTGSPLALMADTRLISELDAATLQNNAAREAWGYSVQAESLRLRAKQAEQAGSFAAAGTILGGLGRSAGIAYGR